MEWSHSACASQLHFRLLAPRLDPSSRLLLNPYQDSLSFHDSRLEPPFLRAGASMMAPAQHCVSLPFSELPQDPWADSWTCSSCLYHWYGFGVGERVAGGWLGASRGSLPPETLPPQNCP
eukprot:775173-Pelagomonas_calceolata.AAC.5